MKHNQKDEASKPQSDKGASQQKQMPKNQQSNSGKLPQHGSSDREHYEEEGDHMGKQGSKKHAETGKTK
jgi:hypothetical protein